MSEDAPKPRFAVAAYQWTMSGREEPQPKSTAELALLAALVEAFNLALVAWWREREARREAMHAAMGYELTEDEMNAIVEGE
jgi:hypothetical protein